MKWKIINNNKYELASKDLLNTLLENRGVKDIDALLNVNKDNIHHWSELGNIYEGLEMYREHISKGNHIHIIQDADYDGISSSVYIYNYTLKNYGVKCTYHIHPNKEHGIIMKELKALDYFNDIDLIISPDGGSFDYEAQEELIKLGKDILVLDHHSPE